MGDRNGAQHDLREARHADDVEVSDADAAYRIAGMFIVTLFPALFWTSLLAAVGAAVGHMPSALVLATFASAIAGFLAAVWHALLRAVPA
jgi:hypothetical protein